MMVRMQNITKALFLFLVYYVTQLQVLHDHVFVLGAYDIPKPVLILVLIPGELSSGRLTIGGSCVSPR